KLALTRLNEGGADRARAASDDEQRRRVRRGDDEGSSQLRAGGDGDRHAVSPSPAAVIAFGKMRSHLIVDPPVRLDRPKAGPSLRRVAWVVELRRPKGIARPLLGHLQPKADAGIEEDQSRDAPRRTTGKVDGDSRAQRMPHDRGVIQTEVLHRLSHVIGVPLEGPRRATNWPPQAQ